MTPNGFVFGLPGVKIGAGGGGMAVFCGFVVSFLPRRRGGRWEAGFPVSSCRFPVASLQAGVGRGCGFSVFGSQFLVLGSQSSVSSRDAKDRAIRMEKIARYL